MSNYIFNSTNGTIIPDTADIKTTVQNEYTNAFIDYGTLSLEDATPQGRLIDLETNARVSTITYTAEAANAFTNIALSGGIILDCWGANFATPRNPALSSTVPVTVGGVAGTVIPANTEAQDVNGLLWQNESEIIIGAGGTATGTFKCVTTGPVTLSTGKLTKIVASGGLGIDGWETITNTADATIGAVREPDGIYKRRFLQSLFKGSALFGNYASACYNVADVADVYTYDNPYGTSLTLDGITIPAHSVYVCVDGGNAADVAYALYTVKSAGAGWAGNTTVTVTDETYGTVNTVSFQTPAAVNFVVSVSVTNIMNANADLSSEIKTVITDYFGNVYEADGYEKIGIRATIDPFVIASLLQSQINGIAVNSVTVGLKTVAEKATVTILKASVTSGIIWASVDAATFGTAISATNGRYNFIFDGSDWKLSGSTVTLSDYGITVTGTPVNNDKISVLYSTGNASANPIQIYADEKAVIAASDITVNINE